MTEVKSLNQRIAELAIGVPLRFEVEEGITFIFRVGLDDNGIPFDVLKDYEDFLDDLFETVPEEYEIASRGAIGKRAAFALISFDDGQLKTGWSSNLPDAPIAHPRSRREAVLNAVVAYLEWKKDEEEGE